VLTFSSFGINFYLVTDFLLSSVVSFRILNGGNLGSGDEGYSIGADGGVGSLVTEIVALILSAEC
jgi:hypothetical protein